MRRSITTAVAAGLVAMSFNTASAQPSAQDFAAFAALVSTPIGAFAPMSAGPAKGAALSGSSISLRVSSFKFEGATESNNTIGGSYTMKAGTNALVNANLGYQMCGTDCGTIMLGADLISPLWAQPATAEKNMAFSANLQGSVGYGLDQSPAEANALSFAVGIPVGVAMEQENKSRISAFVTPGFGWGKVSATGASESGTRPFFGVGGEWVAPAGWALHVGIQKVMIDDGPTNVGAGFNWKLGQ